MEVNFVPQQPLVVDTFKSCEGLSRIAFLDGNGVVTESAASNFESTVLRERGELSKRSTLFAGSSAQKVHRRSVGNAFLRALPTQVMLGKIVKKTDKTEAAKGKK